MSLDFFTVQKLFDLKTHNKANKKKSVRERYVRFPSVFIKRDWH